MRRRFILFVNIALMVLFCPSFTKSEATEASNDSLYLDAKHREIAMKDVGYSFLQGYRTALKNGWRGIQDGAGINVTPKCQSEIFKLFFNKSNLGLLMQCNNYNIVPLIIYHK
jgi:hypothetical protein